MLHLERHRRQQMGWLRASVLGANDGLISTSGLVIGVSTANAASHDILVIGLAGVVAGALSMAAGEYVSVSTQSDAERAETEKERRELLTQPEAELREMAEIYKERGLSADIAETVAQQLTDHDALSAHLRDELGISELVRARPVQAALSSAASFCVGATFPLVTAVLLPGQNGVWAIAGVSLLLLTVLGGSAAYMGGAPVAKGALRVLVWGALAMATTALIGELFGLQSTG
ncbi:VIT family protein [Lysobacter sp. S4-A87]|uniref:VIT1/CCC1 transporter family protein n=1 Tax=Lysobacter sp. S4-A87 TaxID=2925843 RepID=UPI001F53C371|nr:VIT family protein [Lysobacter sp. S4-A87]UNK49830.1 VIT family protein [Lysobacter sp. S4-A87]